MSESMKVIKFDVKEAKNKLDHYEIKEIKKVKSSMIVKGGLISNMLEMS